MINIFEYQNYRTYLKDYYEEEKRTKKYFSYRYFAEKAGINASAFLYYVIENKRNLTKNSILKISQAIGHGKQEAEYFENLVFFNQSRTIAEKTSYYNHLIDTRKHIDIKRVGKNQMEYYSAWYHSVIREIAPLVNFKDDYARLAQWLEPAITPRQAKQSVQLLQRLGFLERDENGLYHQTDTLIGATVSGADAFPIEQFQREMLSLALTSYENVPRDQRLSASTTFSVSEETFKLFVLKTLEFRTELLELAKLDTSQERVYQFTFNMFPVSKSVRSSEADISGEAI